MPDRRQIARNPVVARSAAGEGPASVPPNDKRTGIASCAAFIVALLLLAAMLATLFEKNLINTLAPQSADRELYGIAAALTKLRFGVGGSAIDMRILATLRRGGITDDPLPELGESYPENLRDPTLLQSALREAQTIDVAPPRTYTNAAGDYVDLTGFTGEDIGIGTYTLLAFTMFGLNIPALTYFYFVIVTASLVLYGIGHGRCVGAMAAATIMTLALYVVVCVNFINFVPAGFMNPLSGTDIVDPRFLGTIAALPVLHVIALWASPDNRLGVRDYVVLAPQSLIFAFALQIRAPVIWAVLAMLAFWAMIVVRTACRDRSLRSLWQWRASRSVFTLATVLAVLATVRILAVVSLSPVYAAEGDIARHTFWQGLLSSLQLTPEWDQKYSASVNGAEGDAMPATMARIAIMKLPPDQQRQYLTGDGVLKRTALEKFSRIAFFDIAWHDPRFVLYTFFVAKPLRIAQSEALFFRGLFAGLPVWNALVPVAVLVALIWLAARHCEVRTTLLAMAKVVPLFVLVSWLPNWLVALNPMVMIDNFVWVLFLLSAILVLIGAAIARLAGAGKHRPAIASSRSG
jgi:hypothetical protein